MVMDGRAILVLAVLSVAAGAGLEAGDRRVAPVTTTCPADAPVRRVDASGASDGCAQEGPPVCAPDLWLRADFEKNDDRCVRALVGGRRHSRAASSVGPPACAAPLALAVREGPDVCQRLVLPTCPTGFRLQARVGEDRCVIEEEKK